MTTTSISPEAYFDCLSISIGAPSSVAPLNSRELHLFSYLACLLALFEGEPIGDWGYQFALTSQGYPHSAEFEFARSTLVDIGMFASDDVETITPTDRASAELDDLSQLTALSRRRRWLGAATDCALALPVGSIRYAVAARDDLIAATGSGQPRNLVTPSYIDRIHDEKRVIEEALGGESADLLAPAVAWLSLYILSFKGQVAA